MDNPQQPQEKKHPSNLLLIIVLIIALAYVIMLVRGKVTSRKPQYEPPAPSSTRYEVTKSTGFYKELSIDSKTYYSLPVGKILETANGENNPSCRILTESETKYNLCEFRDPKNGNVGWVLIKWLKHVP